MLRSYKKKWEMQKEYPKKQYRKPLKNSLFNRKKVVLKQWKLKLAANFLSLQDPSHKSKAPELLINQE